MRRLGARLAAPEPPEQVVVSKHSSRTTDMHHVQRSATKPPGQVIRERNRAKNKAARKARRR